MNVFHEDEHCGPHNKEHHTHLLPNTMQLGNIGGISL